MALRTTRVINKSLLNGAKHANKLKRTIVEDSFGTTMKTVKTLTVITKVQLTDNFGHKPTDNFFEDSTSLRGQYAPGQFQRLTGFSQNEAKLVDAWKRWENKEFLYFEVAGEEMPNYGMNVREMAGFKKSENSDKLERVVLIEDPNAISAPAASGDDAEL